MNKMKFGNISQVITPVPNFFMDPTKEIDAFKLYYPKKNLNKKINRCNSYFGKNNLMGFNLDINLNNNPREINQKFTTINKVLYLHI